MKKIIACFLTILVVLSLVSCGSASSGSAASNNKTETAKETIKDIIGQAEETVEQVKEEAQNIIDEAKGEMEKEAEQAEGSSEQAATETENQVEDAADQAEETADQPSESSKSSKDITFESFTPIDNGECSVTVKELDPDNIWGYTVKVNLENKSPEKTYMFSVQSASVNGVSSDPFFATEVAPGKKANGEISFTSADLEENGITDFTDIEMAFRVYDTDDWMADPVADQSFHIYPYGEENATQFVREAQPTDNVLVDNENLTVIVTGQEEDPIWGYSVKLFLVNKTGMEVMFSVENASVNGYMADPFWATTVGSGKCAFASLTWMDSTLEENDITEIEEIEFTMNAYDANNWTGDYLLQNTFTITP